MARPLRERRNRTKSSPAKLPSLVISRPKPLVKRSERRFIPPSAPRFSAKSIFEALLKVTGDIYQRACSLRARKQSRKSNSHPAKPDLCSDLGNGESIMNAMSLRSSPSRESFWDRDARAVEVAHKTFQAGTLPVSHEPVSAYASSHTLVTSSTNTRPPSDAKSPPCLPTPPKGGRVPCAKPRAIHRTRRDTPRPVAKNDMGPPRFYLSSEPSRAPARVSAYPDDPLAARSTAYSTSTAIEWTAQEFKYYSP